VSKHVTKKHARFMMIDNENNLKIPNLNKEQTYKIYIHSYLKNVYNNYIIIFLCLIIFLYTLTEIRLKV